MNSKIKIKKDDFDFDYINVDLPNKTYVYCDEPYALTDLEQYLNSFGEDFKTYELEDGLNKVTISEVHGNTAFVDLNQKYSTTIDLSKEKKEYLSYITEGVTLDLKLIKNKNDDSFTASFSNAVSEMNYREIYGSIGQKVAYMATVKELVNGGYFLNIDGVEVFMPGSLASMNKLSNFEALVGKKIYVCPVNYSDQFQKIVVSHRDYLRTLKPFELEKIKHDILYTGKITGTSGFGIFAEFNTTNLNDPLVLTGLIPSSEMDEVTLKLFNSRQFKDGQEIQFYVKFVSDREGNKIILSKHYLNWDEIYEKYKPNTEVKFTVLKIENNVVFGSIDDTRLIGTIANYQDPLKIGDNIQLFMSKVDNENKRCFLKQTV